MTIEISRPELEQLISSRLQSGEFRDVEDLLMHVLATDPSYGQAPSITTVGDLVNLFARSPFAGADIEFERASDLGRDIEL